MRTTALLRAYFGLITLLVLGTSTAAANSLTLAWDPATDGLTSGYYVVYGTVSGTYTARVNVGSVTTYRVEGLQDGTRYYFRVQAYGASGELSDYSAEVTGLTSGTAPGGGGGGGGTGGGGTGGGGGGGGGGSTGGGGGGGGSAAPPASAGSSSGSATTSLNVVAGMRDARMMNIAWTPGSGPYRVEVGTAPGQTTYSAVTADLGIDFDTATLPIGAYYVRVRPVVGGVPQQSSNEVVVPGSGIAYATVSTDASGSQCTEPPGAPRAFVAAANGNSVHLSWQQGFGVMPSSYLLMVGSAPGLVNLMTASFPGQQTAFGAQAAAGFYALRLAAMNSCGASTWGAEFPLSVGNVSAPIGAAPGLPGTLSAQVIGRVLTLTWAAPASGGATRYLIEATTPGGPVSLDTGNGATTFSHADTPPGQYVITVRAGNAAGFGPPSNPVTIVVP